jgi:hypothetical protein
MDRDLDDESYPESDYEEESDYSVNFQFVTLTQAVSMSQIALDLHFMNNNNYSTERKRRNAIKKIYSWFYEENITRKESRWKLH